MNFTALHQQNDPLLLANVWDVTGARAAEAAGYRALGTSSAAISAMLGYADGEGLTFDELFYIVCRIKSAVTVPLSVDIEAGYGDTPFGIIANIQKLADAGIVGINIEDSRVLQGQRRMDNAGTFARTLAAIRKACQDVFINVRTDAFLLNREHALEETLQRGRLYASCGADGLFVPCLREQQDIVALAKGVALPLNIMAVPGLADFRLLAQWGVRRISMGNVLHAAAQARVRQLLSAVPTQHAFLVAFNDENHR